MDQGIEVVEQQVEETIVELDEVLLDMVGGGCVVCVK